MKLAIELPDAQADRLRAEAQRLGLSPEDFTRAALSDLLSTPDAEFENAAAECERRIRISTSDWLDARCAASRSGKSSHFTEPFSKAPAAPRGFETRLITMVIYRYMALAHSRLTGQGQISVPAKVRQKLGVGPGSVLEWNDEGDKVVVRKAGRYSSEDVHRSLFPKGAHRKTIAEMKAGIRRHIKKRHAGR
jgi:antitoxin PrlF